MSKRILPQPENNQVCPPDGYSIRKFYNGYFESSYIILHPFFKVKKPDQIDFNSENYPSKEKMTECCEKIKWSEFLKMSKIKDYKELDIAIRNSIHGLNKKHRNDESLNKLKNALEQYKIYQPNEGLFEELLLEDMMKALLNLDFNWVFLADEFGTERKLTFIEDIIDNKTQLRNEHRNIYTPKSEVLYSVHWDSHFTLLSSTKNNLEKIVTQFDFEGFYCDEKTEIYWSVK